MNLRPFRIPTLCATLLAALFTTAAASAQEPDYTRFRGGVSLEGGALLVPGVVNIGAIGVTSQLGVQIDNNWGVYGVPNFDILFGKLGGIGLGAAVLFDYTFDRLPISVGAGPEVGVFAAIGGTNCGSQAGCTSVSDAGGAFYGARLHFAYHPVIVRYRGLARRKALTIGVDLRLLDGAFGSATATNTTATATASVNGFALSPMVSIGYTAF